MSRNTEGTDCGGALRLRHGGLLLACGLRRAGGSEQEQAAGTGGYGAGKKAAPVAHGRDVAATHRVGCDDVHHYLRSGLKPARTSSEKSCGCSQAAKCPPLSSLL